MIIGLGNVYTVIPVFSPVIPALRPAEASGEGGKAGIQVIRLRTLDSQSSWE